MCLLFYQAHRCILIWTNCRKFHIASSRGCRSRSSKLLFLSLYHHFLWNTCIWEDLYKGSCFLSLSQIPGAKILFNQSSGSEKLCKKQFKKCMQEVGDYHSFQFPSFFPLPLEGSLWFFWKSWNTNLQPLCRSPQWKCFFRFLVFSVDTQPVR